MKPRRILLFSFGVVLGCIMVYFTLIKGKNRTYWLPENRIKDKILNTHISYSSQAKCMMICKNISEGDLMQTLKEGDVNFSESHIRDTPTPSYVIDGTLSTKKIKLVIATVDSISEVKTIIDLQAEKNSCLCP